MGDQEGGLRAKLAFVGRRELHIFLYVRLIFQPPLLIIIAQSLTMTNRSKIKKIIN